MLYTEFNMEDAISVAKEEAWKGGREESREEIFALLRQGYTLDEVERMLFKNP